MIKKLLTPLSWFVAAILLLFTLRRWLFLLAALLPDRQMAHSESALTLPDVLLLVPIRNEAESLPDLCQALCDLNYPLEKLEVVFIDDGSTDDSAALLQRWVNREDNWRVLTLTENQGKAMALNHAVATIEHGQVIAIYDADERPHPNALLHLVQPFADNTVGGVSGRRAVSNSLYSPAASYTTFEGLVHQLVTMRAKDRLKLAPAILGANCAYRRTALAEVGNFKPGALLEDSDLTLKLVRAGWDIRFVQMAVSSHHVPETIAGYWQQHTRWARGFNEVAKEQSGVLLANQKLSVMLRLELLIFSLGYLDRLALLVGGGLALAKHRVVAWTMALSLLTPLLQTLAALKIANAPVTLWRRVIWLPVFFLLDIAMAATGFWETVRRVPQIWEERQARK